jgi:hypothetical protein
MLRQKSGVTRPTPSHPRCEEMTSTPGGELFKVVMKYKLSNEIPDYVDDIFGM